MTRLTRGWMRTCAAIISAAMISPACATARYNTTRIGTPEQTAAARPDPALMAEFVKKLPVGSRIRVDLADGRTVRGTLMRGDSDPIVIQRRTRVPESPLEIRIADVRAMELDQQTGSSGKTIAIGVAAGAGAALGVLLILAAIFAD